MNDCIAWKTARPGAASPEARCAHLAERLRCLDDWLYQPAAGARALG